LKGLLKNNRETALQSYRVLETCSPIVLILTLRQNGYIQFLLSDFHSNNGIIGKGLFISSFIEVRQIGVHYE